MSVLDVTVTTSLPAAEVLRILTDFEGRRSAAWRGIDDKHFAVHDVGDDWADVTEGNAFAWERERYQWDAARGTVSVTTTDSNLWDQRARLSSTLRPRTMSTARDSQASCQAATGSSGTGSW